MYDIKDQNMSNGDKIIILLEFIKEKLTLNEEFNVYSYIKLTILDFLSQFQNVYVNDNDKQFCRDLIKFLNNEISEYNLNILTPSFKAYLLSVLEVIHPNYILIPISLESSSNKAMTKIYFQLKLYNSVNKWSREPGYKNKISNLGTFINNELKLSDSLPDLFRQLNDMQVFNNIKAMNQIISYLAKSN